MSDLKVRVGCDTSEFNQGVANVQRTVKQLGENIMGQFKDIGKGVVAAFAFEKVAEFFSKTIENVAQLKDLSSSTGLSTNFLQDLKLNAQETGTDLEKVTKTFEHFNSELQSDEPSKKFAGALAQIGLNINDLKAMNPDEVYTALTNGIAGVGDESKRSALAMDLLGKGAAGLLPLIEKLAVDPDKLAFKLTQSDIENTEKIKNLWAQIGTNIEVASGKTVGFFGSLLQSGEKNVKDNQTNMLMDSIKGLSAADADKIYDDYQKEIDARAAKAGFNPNAKGRASNTINSKIRNEAAQSVGSLVDFATNQKAQLDAAKKQEVQDESNATTLEKEAKQLDKIKSKREEIADLKEKSAYDDMSNSDKIAFLDKKIKDEKNKQNFSSGPLDSDSMVDSAKKQADYELQRAELVKKMGEEKKQNIKEAAHLQDELDKQSADKQIKVQQDKIKETENAIKRMEDNIKKSVSSDTLREHGGGIAHVRYATGATTNDIGQLNRAQDQLKAQEMDLQRQQLEEQKKQTEAVQAQLRYLENLIQNNPAFSA